MEGLGGAVVKLSIRINKMGLRGDRVQWWVPRRRGPGRRALWRWGGLGGDDPGRASLPSPSEFLPRALPLNPRDRAQLPFPPPEAKSLPYLNELLRGGEAAHTERHEDPAPGIAALGGVVSELLADLAVDLIPRQAGRQGREKHCLRGKAPPLPAAGRMLALPLARDHLGGGR